MSTRDHDQKFSEERLGRYTPGARLDPEPSQSGGTTDPAEPRSWSGAGQDGASPPSFGGAEATPYGQMVSGSSDQVGGGYGAASVGGYGQQGLGSQWGQGGFGPLTQGANYSAGGAAFGPPGFAPYPEGPASRGPGGGAGKRGPAFDRPSSTPLFGSPRDSERPVDFGGSANDHHEPHYRHWREAKLAGHDRDYARWRDDQARRYDEEYRTWRNGHHTAFTQAFDGWRDQRSSQTSPAGGAAPSADLAHGANPTLGDIAEGGTGAPRRHRHPGESEQGRSADLDAEGPGVRDAKPAM